MSRNNSRCSVQGISFTTFDVHLHEGRSWPSGEEAIEIDHLYDGFAGSSSERILAASEPVG